MLYSATAQLLLLLMLMAILPDALSDNVPSCITPLNTGLFDVFTPREVVQGAVLTTVESSIGLHHPTRPSHSASLKLWTSQGFLSMGLHVGPDGKLHWFCRTKSKDDPVKVLTFPARASISSKTDVFHDVDVQIQVIKRGKNEYELKSSVRPGAGWPPLSCQATLPRLTKAQLTATFTSSPLSDPLHAETPVTASFKSPNITNHFPSTPKNKQVVLRLQGMSRLQDYPTVMVETHDQRAFITHSWDKTKLRQAPQPQRGPSTGREPQQSLQPSGSGNPQAALTSPTPGGSSRGKFSKLFKNPFSKKP